jgi:hypothetical protein
MKVRLMLLALSAGAVALQLGSCARWFGDVLGDSFWLSVVD